MGGLICQGHAPSSSLQTHCVSTFALGRRDYSSLQQAWMITRMVLRSAGHLAGG